MKLPVLLPLCLLVLVGTIGGVDEAKSTDMYTKELTKPTHIDWQQRPTRYFENYNWLLSLTDRRRGLTYMGPNSRLRAKLQGWLHGKQDLRISVVGSSITALQGVADARNGFPTRIVDMLHSTFPEAGKLHMVNGAVPGTISLFMSVCLQSHVPMDSDVVIVDYTANDPVGPGFTTDVRKGFERLLRKLLNYPSKPAVILLHNFMWQAAEGKYWGNSESAFYEFATYYGIPQVSVKAAAHRHWAANDDGFWVNTTRHAHLNESVYYNNLRGKVFFYDSFHPDGDSGHRAISELLFHLFNSTVRDIARLPVTPAELQHAQRALRSPMVPGNFESLEDRCLVGRSFQKTALNASGFSWTDEGRRKWGFVAETPGSHITLNISTLATSRDVLRTADGRYIAAEGPGNVMVELAYLKSYRNMGTAIVSCVGGCTCPEKRFDTSIDPNKDPRNSQTHLFTFFASQHKVCLIKVTVDSESSSSGHKVKLMGVIVSEQAGATHSIQNSVALEQHTMQIASMVT